MNASLSSGICLSARAISPDMATASPPTRLSSNRRVPRATSTVFSSIVRARFENQNSSPLCNRIDAKIATTTVGTAATIENNATSRVCNCPVPSPRRAALCRAISRAIITISTIAGSRLAISSSAISGGENKVPGSPALRTTAMVASIVPARAIAEPIPTKR